MRRLILFRHGKADAAPLGGSDRDRPLDARGRAESSATARWLARAGYSPDLALVSPSTRTRETWDAARVAFPHARLETPETLYLAEAEEVLEEAHAWTGHADTVIVVAHNPGLQELAAQLAEGGEAPPEVAERLSESLPTATACVFTFDPVAGPILEAVYTPPRDTGESPRWIYQRPPIGGPP